MRRPDALGARIDALAGNPWFDAATVPPGLAPPELARPAWASHSAIHG